MGVPSCGLRKLHATTCLRPLNRQFSVRGVFRIYYLVSSSCFGPMAGRPCPALGPSWQARVKQVSAPSSRVKFAFLGGAVDLKAPPLVWKGKWLEWEPWRSCVV
ncbi:hypothetical protein KC338_g115 [Hortaea werneckii]|nr:hypothetical protein KC338_g115 [Hortaea werneckii]